MDNIKKELISLLKTLVASLIIVYVLNNFVFRPVKVQGSSMYPNLIDGEYGISSIFNLKKEGIERFDIVIIYIPENNEYLVKRVIGLPNEKISYNDNKLYVNGEYVEEPFLNGINTFNIDEMLVEDNKYYCLGDNREYSKDSRFYGSFSMDQIKSKDIYVIYPFDKIGRKIK